MELIFSKSLDCMSLLVCIIYRCTIPTCLFLMHCLGSATSVIFFFWFIFFRVYEISKEHHLDIFFGIHDLFKRFNSALLAVIWRDDNMLEEWSLALGRRT